MALCRSAEERLGNARLVEQQRELSTICDSTHGALFVCHYIAENSLL